MSVTGAPVMRAKFEINSVKETIDRNGNSSLFELDLHAVYSGSKENEVWSKYTPSGHLTMSISNGYLRGAFLPGQQYFLDFILVNDGDEPPAAK